MGALTLAENSGGGGNTAGSRYFLKRRPGCRRKYDHSISIPCPAGGRTWRVAQCNGRATRDLNLLELSVRKETDKPAVRRPERIQGPLGSCQRLRGERIERANPQQIFAVSVPGKRKRSDDRLAKPTRELIPPKPRHLAPPRSTSPEGERRIASLRATSARAKGRQ